MVGHAVIEVEPTEPSIGQVQMHFLAQAAFGADAKAIPHQKHADQEFRVDRRAARVAVELRKMGANATQIDKPINRAQQVGLRHMIFQRKLVKQSRLRFLSRSHHHSIPRSIWKLNQ